MLPGPISDSYKQYKSDTDRFATWLVNAAQKCGFQPRDWPDSHATPASGKSKGKSKGKGNKIDKGQSKYRATTRELQELAQHVSETAVRVPEKILAIAKRAIALRKAVGSFFTSGRGGRTVFSSSDKTHAYFTEVMEKICDLLEWRTMKPAGGRGRAQSPDDKDAATMADDAQSWLNRFAALTVEELNDAAENDETLIQAEVVEEENDELLDHVESTADAFYARHYFRMLCLFHDLQNWRSFIFETWKEYGERKIDLSSASVVTDTALQLARHLISDFTDSMPDIFRRELPDDGLSLQLFLYSFITAARGTEGPPSTELGLPFYKENADVVDRCFLGIGSLLESFASVLQHDHLPVYKPGYYGVYNPRADRAKMSMVDRFHEDKILLLEILPEFATMNQSGITLPAQDEITTGFVDFIRTKKPTLWLSFAGQIMLDAHHALRYSSVNAHADLRIMGLRLTKTIDDYFKLSETHPTPLFWPKEGDEEIRRIRDNINFFIEQDLFGHFREAAVESRMAPSRQKKKKKKKKLTTTTTTTTTESTKTGATTAENLLFSRNPVLSGIFLFHLNLRMQTVGQALVTQWYDVQQLAFLYNLAQKMPSKTSTKKLVWPDLEMFIRIHGESHIFVGGRPSDAQQSLNRLEIATGISSVSDFASNPRKPRKYKPMVTRGKTPRHLAPTTKVVNLFRSYYLGDGKGSQSGTARAPAMSISGHDVEKLLNELADEEAPTPSSSSTTGAKSSSDGKTGKGKPAAATLIANPQHLFQRQWHNTHSLGALQLLVLIKSKLCEEEAALMFDYLTMHRRAIEVFRLIRDKEHHKFVQYFSAEYMPDESMIANIVILIHHVARGSALASQQLGMDLSKTSAEVTSRIIMSCGDVMREYIDRDDNGDTVGKSLRTFCKNKSRLLLSSEEEQEDDFVDPRSLYWFAFEEVLDPVAMESLRTGIPC